ncbi:hypothetical protein E0Z10_g53 [Xylaria hypoxylon]|uniref:BTB domain-containing protein n=1 Tax=Xylaria hypoxylon TaxID=37992 RepID=A0A4Z0YX56_9PEZI|nr:hypothetical protein E0Z10_g53 [Xylaria hypoxylon]
MAVHEVVLDPDGDILVIVPGKLPENYVENAGPHERESGETESLVAEAAVEEPIAEEVTVAEEVTETEEVTAAEAANSEEQQPDASTTREEEDQWRFKASSKHLALASPYIKEMMAGPSREANEVHDDGLLHLAFSGFDVDAISLILSVIHGLNRRVPRTVDLSMLAQIARIVDYLSCHEAMELYASIWIDHLQGPTNSSREDWDAWISVAGVFQNAGIFNRWTRVAIVQKLNCPPSLELPILSQAYGKLSPPPRIPSQPSNPSTSDAIDQQRQLHLENIFSCIYDHMDRLSEQKTCSVECDAILLGTLVRQMRANSLPSLCPTKPYEGLSVSSVVKTIKGLAVPEWYSKVHGPEEPAPNPFEFWGAPKKIDKLRRKKGKTKVKKTIQLSNDLGAYGIVEEVEDEELVVIEHNCGFDELVATVNSLESKIQGLDLEDDLGIWRAE